MSVGHLVHQYIFQDVCVGGGCHGQVGGTIFQVGMTAADQRRYLRTAV